MASGLFADLYVAFITMADPTSVAALIIQITQVIHKIYKYGKGVKDAKADIESLCTELYALKGVLEHIQLNIG